MQVAEYFCNLLNRLSIVGRPLRDVLTFPKTSVLSIKQRCTWVLEGDWIVPVKENENGAPLPWYIWKGWVRAISEELSRIFFTQVRTLIAGGSINILWKFFFLYFFFRRSNGLGGVRSFRIFSFFSSFSSTTEKITLCVYFYCATFRIKTTNTLAESSFSDLCPRKSMYGQNCRKNPPRIWLEIVQNSADLFSAQISLLRDFAGKNLLNFSKISLRIFTKIFRKILAYFQIL
jgi:hypothetical protein